MPGGEVALDKGAYSLSLHAMKHSKNVRGHNGDGGHRLSRNVSGANVLHKSFDIASTLVGFLSRASHGCLQIRIMDNAL